jgi:hypothetical protein
VVDGSGIARRSIAAAARFWPTPLEALTSSEAEVESEPSGRARQRPSAEARAESEPWGRAKWSSSSSGAEPKSEP